MAKESGDFRINNLADSYYSQILLTPFLINQEIMTFVNQESQFTRSRGAYTIFFDEKCNHQ